MKSLVIRRGGVAAAGLLAAATLAACTSPAPADDAGAAGAGEDVTIKIGSIPVTDAVVLQQGAEQGFFEEEGITVEFGNPAAGGSSVVAAVIAGEYQVGYSATLSVFQAIEGGNDIVLIAPASGSFDDADAGTNDLIVDPAEGFETAKDLEGKSVAVNAAGGYAEMLARNAVAKAGGDPDLVQYVQIGFAEALPALEAGQVQAFSSGEPFGTLARDAGMETLVNSIYEIQEEPWLLTGWFASRAAIEENPDLYERIQRAITKSLAYSVEHEDELREMIPEFAGIDQGLAKEIRLSNYDIELSVETAAPMAEAAVEQGMLSTMPDLESIIWQR